MTFRAVPAAMLRSEIEKAEQWARPGAPARPLARAVAGIEMRAAGVRVTEPHAILHLPGAAPAAVAPAGIRNPDRRGTLTLRIRGLVDDAALEDHVGPVLQRVVASGCRASHDHDQENQQRSHIG